MKTQIIKLFILGCALLSISHALADQFTIQRFRDVVSNFQYEEQRYQSSPSGSYEERLHDQNRRSSAETAKAIIQQYDAFMGLSASETESLFLEFHQSYQSARSGSLGEGIYDLARRSASVGLKTNAVAEMQYAYSADEALRLTLMYNSRYQSASSGSLLESAYNEIRTAGFDIAKQKLQQDVSRIFDFRQAEALFIQNNSSYQASSSGSKTEDFYNVARRIMMDATLNLFKNQAYQMNFSDLSSIQSEYNSKYQSSSSGSLAETLYRSIRDEARTRLSYSQTQPNPQPQPNQQPRFICSVRAVLDRAGNQLFNVIDQSGRALLRTSSQHAAEQFAHTDSRCRM